MVVANDKDDDDDDVNDDRNDDESSDEENKPLTRGEFNQKLLSALNDSVIASSNASKEFYAISTRNQLQNNALLANLLTKMVSKLLVGHIDQFGQQHLHHHRQIHL